MQRLAIVAAVASALCGTGVASAAARQQLRTVTYGGLSMTVPRTWPVYNLARAPRTCVRFNRHAVYLGVPGSEQQCTAQAVGRTEAILIEPLGAAAARGTGASALPVEGSATTFAVPSARVLVTATWLHDPQLVARALHRRTLPTLPARRVEPPRRPRIASAGGPSGGAGASSQSVVYTGPGFDACDAPSAQKMSAWTAHSPYHAIGIYIGGANAACPPSSDPNLTPPWLSSEAAAGWHFIPTYVGLQAPSNSCGCTAIKPKQASAEGTAAATDAVNDAQSLDLPAGTPIYDDMESYSRTQSNTSAVLAFLGAWTAQLHAKGYLSGVYGNANSAIADLASQEGTSYPEPDDIWFAAWPGDGATSTSDPNIPSSDWVDHQRLHQYRGGHAETYGGVTLDIDSDYLDGATAGDVVIGLAPPPSLTVSPSATGVSNLTTSWSGLGLAGWHVLAGTSPTTLSTIQWASLRGAPTEIRVASFAPYFAVQAMGTSGQVLATSAIVAAPAHLALYGRSSFYGESSGVGGVPVGCYLATGCHLTATISAGRTTISRSASQTFRSGGSGLFYYRLTATGRTLLSRARGARLPVRITVRDTSGVTTGANMVLIPFTTSGRSPRRSVTPSPMVSAAGSTVYVNGGSGGILARCSAVSACWITATLTAGNVKLAAARAQPVGGLEDGYLYFALSTRGRQLLNRAAGNQLAANLVLRCGTSVATARIALVRFA